MKNCTKKIFSFILSAVMVLSMLPVFSYAADIPVYYISASGSDSNDGLSASAPFATLKAAMTALGTNEGTIKIIGTYSPTNSDYISHTQNIDIVGYDATSSFDSSKAAISFGGPVTFKNITYSRGTNSYILSRGNDITFGQGFKTTSNDDWMVFGNGQNSTSVNDINVTVMDGTFTGKFNVGGIMPKAGYTVNNDANINVSGGSISHIILGSTNWGSCGATTFAKSVVVQHDGGNITKISAPATGNGSPTAITGSLIVINNNGTAAPTYDTSLDSISIGAKYYINAASGGYVSPVVDENGNAVAGKFNIEIEDPAHSAIIKTSSGKTVISEGGQTTLPAGLTSITYEEYEKPSAGENVYFISASGSDSNSGKSADAPLATLGAAYEKLAGAEGTVYVIGTYTVKLSDGVAHAGNVDICGYDASSVITGDKGQGVSFGGPVTFKNITYTRGTNSYIVTRGHDVTFGEGFVTTSTDDWIVFGGGMGNTNVNAINVNVESGNFTGKFNVGAIMPASSGFSVNNDAKIILSGGSIANLLLGSTNWGSCGATTFKKNVVIQNDGGAIAKISAVATGNGSPTKIDGALIVINNNGTTAPAYDATLDSISIGEKYYINSAAGGNVTPVYDENGNAVAGKFNITIADSAKSAMITNGDTKTVISESGEVTLNPGTTNINFADYPPNPGTTIPMTWKEMDKGYITFCFDDNRDDLINYVDIVMGEFNMPLCAAVPSNKLTYQNALLHEIQDRGGEIISHTKTHLVIKPFVTSWADVEAQLGDSYRDLTADGFNINGIILAGGTGQIGVGDTEYRGLIELVTNKYYKYSDKYGLSTQYWKQRNWFSGRTLDDLKAIVDKQITNKTWEVIYGHGLSEVSEETMRGLCEYIAEKEAQGLVKVVTYKYMHENFGDWESPVDFGDTTYTVDFYGTDGTTHLGKSVTVMGKNATAPEGLVAAEGYTFKGWSGTLQNVTNNYSVYAICEDASGNVVAKDHENVLTPPPPPTVFYVDSTNGQDTNDGETAQTAVTSITKALSLAQTDKPFEIKIIGTYNLPNPIGGHTGMMTISGYDASSEIATQASGGYTFAGPVTIKNIKFTNGLYAWMSACGNELILGEGITTSGNHQIVSAGNYGKACASDQKIEVHSGTFNKIGLGPIAFSTVQEISTDAAVFIAGGTVNTINIGGDGWSSGHLGAKFLKNVLIRADGGTLKKISLAANNYAPEFSGAIQVIFNNGVKPQDITSVEKAAAPDGVYTVYSTSGGTVDFVYGNDGKSVTGKFDLTIDDGYYAVINSGDSESFAYQSGEITLPEGKTEITYKALSELKTVIKVTSGQDEYLYYPADTVNITKGGRIALPSGMKKNGMLFGGWYSDSAYTRAVADGAELSDGTTLYARWISLSERDLYTEGIQIRITSEKGLRFVSDISHETRTMLAGLNAENAVLDPKNAAFNTGNVIGYGTVVLPTYAHGDAELIKDGRYDYNGKVYGAKTVPAKNTFGVEETYDKFTAVIIRISDANLARHYSARAYLTYKDASGMTHTAYGKTYDASIYDVAKLIYRNGAADEPEEKREEIMDYIYNNILIKNDGVENPLANTYRALNNEKQLTVGYLGGSITYGSSASKVVNADGTVSASGGNMADSYVNRTTAWLKEQYPDATIDFVNAGISDTATNFGVYRLKDHLMNTNGHGMPDLVFVEFTSNDWIYDNGIEQNYSDLIRQVESLVHGIYDANPYADIVFAFSARKLSGSSRKAYVEVAQHYGIPCVDMGVAMQTLMTARGASNETSGKYFYTVDDLHPSAEGYRVYFEEIKKVLSPMLADTVYYENKKDKTQAMPSVLSRSLWKNARIIPATEFTLSGTYSATQGLTSPMYGTSEGTSSAAKITDSAVRFSGADARAEFTFTGTSFGFIFGMNSSGFDIDYQIDGHGWKKAEVDEELLSFQKYSHTQLFVFEQELAYGEHRIELKFNPTSDGNVNVVIGGAAVCGEDNGLQKLVAMSVDDGPRTTTTPLLLDELKKYGAHATFFCVGSNITDATAPVMQRIIAEGSEIGNHGNLWNGMANMTPEELMADFNTVQTKAYNATGVYPKVFRAPGLSVSETMLKTLPVPVFGGKLGISDWEGEDKVSVQSRINAIMANVVDGRIILTHDVEPNAKAYAATIPQIYAMGYKIVTISELIKLRGYSAPAGSSEQYWEFP
ncbi:MAG: polysaccharide deacetylase family protein [Clostridia bacterium]|nr:polysaccharide deacetylase family protein [Clostridia bacterium]